MIKIKINDTEVEAFEGETIIEVAGREGFAVPSLCYAKEASHKSSCMVCAVKNRVSGQIIPSCSTLPTAGMEIETESDEIREIRTLSLELLLSDHRADCEAPCKVACPAGFDVAKMNRLYDRGEYGKALEFMRNSLVIPATLCYICNAPCEKICRKRDINQPVAIREIKKMLVTRTVLDTIVGTKSNGTKIAVIGSNPAGLSAAYRLCKLGYEVTVFEKSASALIPHIEANKAPAEIVELEIEVIERTGVKIVTSCENTSFTDYSGVISVSGDEANPQWITLSTKTKQPARLVLEGFKLAERLHASLSNPDRESVETKLFNSTYSRFNAKEKQALERQSENDSRATACLYCDCDQKTDCKLRHYATAYGIKNSRYQRDTSSQALNRQNICEDMWFEPAKCIKCGLCVYNSANGFTFVNRGFEMQVILPAENSGNVPKHLTNLCPTGAIYNYEL
jgi:predicted molibdopterin-dependent oxidoreductase YjgC